MIEIDFTKVEILEILKKKRNYLLIFMIICYIIPVFYVYKCYNDNNSLSNIICNEKTRNTNLFFMGLMGIATILYEIERNDIISTILISCLLLCIYGLLLYNEKTKIHYIFAIGGFINIFVFMSRHFYLTYYNIVLGLLLSLCFGLLTSIIIKLNGNNNIFYNEVLYILIFAVYYMYLHYLTCDL